MSTVLLLSWISLGLLSAVAALNILTVRRLTSYTPAGSGPTVSLLIPARNEQENIDRILTAARSQRYQPIEILVLDDDSGDDTRARAERHAAEDDRARVLPGSGPASGWLGKNYACYLLSEQARGDYLLFVDADVEMGPDAVGQSMACMLSTQAGLLSVFAEQECRTRSERLVVPFVHVLLYSFLPIPLVSLLPARSLAAANGQWMLFSRACYRACGGHAAVREVVLEDVELARRVKDAGLPLVLLDGKDTVRVRMYSSWPEIRDGFAKNFFAGAGYRLPVFGAILALLTLSFIVPVLLLPFDVRFAGALLAALLLRYALAVRFGHPLMASTLGSPVGAALVSYIAFISVLEHRRGTGVWKGRQLKGGPA